MKIEATPFGRHLGKEVLAYSLTNANGYVARIITFGARLVEMHMPDRHGTLADVVLGFDDLASYQTTDTYFGATCGRYCNRIRRGQFNLDGHAFQVTPNENGNHLHGGEVGFDKLIWDANPDEADNSVTFTLVSDHGAEGYPGTVSVSVTYRLTQDDRLLIDMSGITDRPTILNMVHHSYWNLAGHASGTVLDHVLTIDADFYTPVDDELLTTGEVLAVANTPFDFRASKPIGRDIHAFTNAGFGRLADEASAGGYDHNFVLRGASAGLTPVMTTHDPHSGRGLRLRATDPGLQFYTGGYLNADVMGKGGHPYIAFGGFTLETQKFPDSPNFAHFPTSRLLPGEVYDHRMELQFFNQ